MITIKSNIKTFLKNYKKKVEKFKISLSLIAEKLAERMCKDMKNLIQTDKRWQDKGNLSEIENVEFRQEKTSETSIRVHIGENLPLFTMKDGTQVNPAFFIEFGFGIVGQNNPKQGTEKYDWEYNIRNHKSYWWFWYEGRRYGTRGREGINFIYQVSQDYKDNWWKYLKEIIAEIANG